MKKLILHCLFIGVMGTSSLFSSNHTIYTNTSKPTDIDFEPQIISMCELTKDNLEDFFMGKLPHIAVKYSEGMTLPCNLFLEGDILKLSSEEIPRTIKALQTFYIRSTEETFLFSINLKDWKSFLEFFAIETRVSLDVKEGTPQIGLTLGLEQKK